MPDEVKKEIFELSRLNAIDLNRLAQLKAAKAIEKAAENQSGTAGAGMGMGMGFAMANQMGQTFSTNQQSVPQTPPPIPTALTFHLVINQQQAGPFDVDTLKKMAAENQFTKEVLVWREGMANWTAASEVSELSTIFGSVPPPIPGV
jgi:hypothetical protein